jgi:NitT/TauT family transport system substrate-binding protein
MDSQRIWASVGVALLLTLASCTPAANSPSSRPATVPPAAAAPTAAAAPAVPVRFAVQTSSSYTAVFLAADRGLFQQEGLDVELIPFSSSSEMVPALATDQIEAAIIGTNAALWNAVARDVSFKAVLDGTTFRPGRGTIALVMRKAVYDAGRGRSVSDLAGLRLTLPPPGAGTTNGCALNAALQRVGGSLNDFTIEPLPVPDQYSALLNGAVDGGTIAEPFLTQLLRQEAIVRLAGLDELYPNFTLAVVMLSPAFYAQTAAAKGLVRAYIRASRDYDAAVTGRSGDAERVAVETIVARHTGVAASTVHDMVPLGLSPNGLPNRDSIMDCYRFFREQNQIPQPVSDAQLTALWGTTLVDEVLNEIGRVSEN